MSKKKILELIFTIVVSYFAIVFLHVIVNTFSKTVGRLMRATLRKLGRDPVIV